VTGLAARPVLVRREEGIAWITLDRPDSLNSMSLELMDSLVVALEQLASDPSVRCVGLRGSGRAFCAGGDIADIARRREEAAKAPSLGALLDAQYRTMLRHIHASRLLHEMPKPTVAAVHGHAVGGGLALALACDFRVVTETAKLRVGFAARALSGDFGISYLLVHTVGSATARELMMLDPVVTGAEAKRIGLATRVCPDDALEATATELVHELACGPTIAFGRMKDNLLAAEHLDFEQVLQVESMNARISANTSDAKEAGLAFAERRAAMFTGS
jgi:2-(1,2-epoxy-1,2-dihydrophenyl)acetyl-CoA isomerase